MAETAQKICAKKKKIRYKKSDWYIDDFSPSSDGNDDKASLRRVIKQGKEAHEKAKKLAGDWGWVGEDCPELLLDMEMTDKGLRAKQCDVYRMYGFDNTTTTSTTNKAAPPNGAAMPKCRYVNA